MRQLSGFIVAGMLGLFALSAGGAGRGSGVHSGESAAQPAQASSVSTTTKHVSTHAPKSPKVPSVGAAAPAPVAVQKTAGERAATGAPANEPEDYDPVLDLEPVSDSPAGYVSPTILQPAVPSYEEIESRNSRVSLSGALRTGTEASVAHAGLEGRDTMWSQIDAASSHAQTVLENQPEYWAAVARLASAEQNVATLRRDGQRNADQTRLAAQKASEATQDIARMRMSTLETDPNFRAALTRNEPAAVVPGRSQ
jgi:hypothetical protein